MRSSHSYHSERPEVIRRAALLCVGWLALAAATVVSAQGPPGGLIQSGKPPELLLLYTGDVIGYLEPCG